MDSTQRPLWYKYVCTVYFLFQIPVNIYHESKNKKKIQKLYFKDYKKCKHITLLQKKFQNFYILNTVIVVEYCHFDPDDGLLVLLRGQKDVRLYGCDPDPLYPNELGSKGRTIQSQVNCDNPDYKTHPKFRDVCCQECSLKPGEM